MIRLVLLGVLLGCLMPFVGALAGVHSEGPYPCQGCAVLAHPYPGCDEAVQGGWICEP